MQKSEDNRTEFYYEFRANFAVADENNELTLTTFVCDKFNV